jgi:hypothetical protein
MGEGSYATSIHVKVEEHLLHSAQASKESADFLRHLNGTLIDVDRPKPELDAFLAEAKRRSARKPVGERVLNFFRF